LYPGIAGGEMEQQGGTGRHDGIGGRGRKRNKAGLDGAHAQGRWLF